MVLLRKKKSEAWHLQIDSVGSASRPSKPKFPYAALQQYTDYYIKKIGKLSTPETDIKLAILIQNHDARDIAIAACAHVMSPGAIKALLNLELCVAPATYYGLEMFLESLIAANSGNRTAISNLEAQWARDLIPYASHGIGAGGKLLEGLCNTLSKSHIPNMNVIPDFAVLMQRSARDFASQLEGFRIRCAWPAAHLSVSWLTTIKQSSPATTPPGNIQLEHILDAQFPTWRIWANWRPSLDRLRFHQGLDGHKRAVIPDLLALDGPDFITGLQPTLREGIIAQYGAEKPWVGYNRLTFEVNTCTKVTLRDMLDKVQELMEVACRNGNAAMRLFVQLCIARPITKESLQVLEGVSRIPKTNKMSIYEAVFSIYTSQKNIGGRHISELECLLHVLHQREGEELRRVMLRPYLINGIQNCIKECQDALKTYIRKKMSWCNIASEFHCFAFLVKESQHFFSHLVDELQTQLSLLPSPGVLEIVIDIYSKAKEVSNGPTSQSQASPSLLLSAVEEYIEQRMVDAGSSGTSSLRTVDVMVGVWQRTLAPERRSLALLIADTAGFSTNDRCQLLNEITDLSDNFVHSFLRLLENYKVQPEMSIVRLTQFLEQEEYAGCWRAVLLQMIEERSSTLLDYTLDNLKAAPWLQWIWDLNSLFRTLIITGQTLGLPVFQPKLHNWCRQLSNIAPTIIRLEERLGDNAVAVRCLLTGGDGFWTERLVRVLDTLDKCKDLSMEEVAQKVAGRLTRTGCNSNDVANALKALSEITPECGVVCQQVVESNESKSTPVIVTEAYLANHLANPDLEEGDRIALKALGTVLGLEVYENGMPDDKLQAVMKFFDDEEAKILKEAERLKAIQTALKLKDPKGTTSLLFQLGIKDTTPLEDELEKLPPDLRANIDTVEGNVVEMNFPLIKFTELQKKAMGSGTANAMIVRLVVDHSKTFQTSFCCHLDNETKSEREYHYPWDQSASKKAHNGPIQQHCHGKMTPLTWQMTRILHRYLKKGHPTLYYIHEHIQERLSQLPYHCIVCDLIHNGSQDPQLRRSTVCHSISCKQIWPKVPLHIRIPELRSDPAVVDLILTTVYAAAMTARMDLLPNCPIRSTNTVLSILGTIPAVKVLQTTNALEQRLALGHQDAEKLLTWACTTFRGFLTSAPSNLRIPGFGQHQFLLANASPEIEAAFLMRRAIHHPDGSTGKVLFHGTPLERLPSILQQGLKICSGTPLQRIGAAHGNGIYMAEDPATSYGYSSTCHNSWQNSKFKNMRVLLGCEVVGPGNRVQSATGGVHLLKEEREVMIRYVFLMEQGAHTPPRQQVENVMESAFWGLRRGTV